MVKFNKNENDRYTKTFFARYLYRNLGISPTRCNLLRDAVDRLHTAFAYCDSNNRAKLADMTVKELLAVFGALEDMTDFDYFNDYEKDHLLRIQDSLRYKNKRYAIAKENGLLSLDCDKPFTPIIEFTEVS